MFDAKQNYRYEIQYYFIPELVEVVSKRILPSAVFTMFDIWERILTFPEPDCCPEALYGAVVVDNQEDTLQYYTLEMSFVGRWVIGSKTQDRHYNYGELDSHNPEAFIDWLSNKLK